MRPILRQLGVLAFIAVVAFVPFFELFEEGHDLEQGTDFVQSLLEALTCGALAVLLTKLFAFFLRWLQFCRIPPESFCSIRNRALGVEPAPPKNVHTLCILRI
jgi:hypothetical protein